MLNRDESGIWARTYQKDVSYLSAFVIMGGALYEGADSRLGKTYWQSLDAMLLGAAGSAAGKEVFRRPRPDQGNDPSSFFQSGNHKSFPSGEMTHVSAIVTPFILEYHNDVPAVWALSALPAYVGVARMKSQAHWQTDILAGGALGFGVGYYAHERQSPWTASVLPGGFSIGYKKQFH